MRGRERRSGDLLWTSEDMTPWRGLAAGDDLVLGITDTTIEARDPATGRIRWKRPSGAKPACLSRATGGRHGWQHAQRPSGR